MIKMSGTIRSRNLLKRCSSSPKNQIYGDLDVKTIVGYGRLPYLSYHQNLSEDDYQV